MADEVLVDHLAMYLNLGDMGSPYESQIGWAKVTRDSETGQNKIEITLDEESSAKLDNMVEAFSLKAIGFAGIKKRPVTETES